MTRENILQTLAGYLQNRRKDLGIRRLGIFGSAAHDHLRAESDIDVVVELERPDLFALIGIQQDLAHLLRRNVDIVRYREGMNSFLKQRIDHEAIYA